ncbi:MAG TPA: 3-deoxy-7-phosphoheptulonate synthase [Firmicutes bacterium]|nr:3-deoxy-7-phosphoheptulonate synthase [Bacillota bacterium]
MIVVMNQEATEEQIQHVQDKLKEWGFGIHFSKGVERTILGAIGQKKPGVMESIEAMDGVEKVVPITQPFKLASREFQSEPSIVRVGNVVFGGPKVVVIAGPCAVENEQQMLQTAKAVKQAGATMLRGGAFKPRTSPYAFQGLEEEGLKILKKVSQEVGLPFVTEVVNPMEVELVAGYASMLQVGARNMQNFTLLKEIGKLKKPVILKRGLAATVDEWLMAAEYILSEGNDQVVLCERGIRTYETSTRNTLDLSAVPSAKRLSHLPIIVDPSHGTGKRYLINPLSKAAVAVGCDGLIIEVHPDPENALSDGPQSLNFAGFSTLMKEIVPVVQAVGRAL